MLLEHYRKYFEAGYALAQHESQDCPGGTDVLSGTLTCRSTGKEYAILEGIPRFVDGGNYADSFGFQWNLFKRTQLDSVTGLPLSHNRFWNNTKWNKSDLRGKRILEVGSGAGRFTEILLEVDDLDVVSFDYSTSVDANLQNNAHSRLMLFQGSIYDLPLEPASFDYLFCYGVLQYTPDPKAAFETLLQYVKPGGRFSMDVYRKIYVPAPWYFPKYFWRPLTKRMDQRTLLKIIEFYIPLWLPFDTFIKNIPFIGTYLAGCLPIPCYNHLGIGLTREQIRQWAILDTFDVLSPAYDQPFTKREVEAWCDRPDLSDVDIFYGSNGIVLNGRVL